MRKMKTTTTMAMTEKATRPQLPGSSRANSIFEFIVLS
jgi:hypothetical protein